MAGLASLTEMGPFQDISRFRMIKAYFAPLITVVTTHTKGFRIIFRIKNRFMDVFMAIIAFYPYLPEAPSVFLFMTGETGSCQMCTGQFKGTFIMHFNCKTGWFKSLDGMTLRTIGTFGLCYELLFVII